jgi:hypothetical protein
MIRLSIRRPVAVSMAYLAVALLGVAAWRNIPIELLPDTQLPRLHVTAQWQGASPETMEALVTAPLEAAVQQVRMAHHRRFDDGGDRQTARHAGRDRQVRPLAFAPPTAAGMCVTTSGVSADRVRMYELIKP